MNTLCKYAYIHIIKIIQWFAHYDCKDKGTVEYNKKRFNPKSNNWQIYNIKKAINLNNKNFYLFYICNFFYIHTRAYVCMCVYMYHTFNIHNQLWLYILISKLKIYTDRQLFIYLLHIIINFSS